MKRYNSAGGLRTLLFFILFINMFGFNASGKNLTPKVKNESAVTVTTFENPDFAFPADVIKDAGKVFTVSLQAGNPEKALKAAMQMAAADALISSDSIATIMKRYEEVAEMSGTPWRNLAILLQARQLTTTYAKKRWEYDSRMLPPEDLNANPILWSGAQFKDQIAKLCAEALADSERLGGTDLSTIGGVLTGLESGNPAHYSVLDFIVYQVIEIYNRSNLGDSGVEIAGDIAPAKLIDRLIAADESFMSEADIKDGGSEALLRARLAKLTYSRGESNNGLYDRSVAELLKLYPVGNPRRGELIAALDSRGKFNTTTLDRKRELFHLISDVKDDKDADVKKYLKSIIDRLMQPEYSVSTPGQWLTSGDTVKINAYNIADGYLLMVPISATQAEGNRVRNQELKATGKVKVIAHIRNDVSEPVENNPAVAVDDVAPGYYAFVMSRTDALAGMFEEEKQDYPNVILVSDLSCFATTDARLQKLPDSGNRKLKPADKYLYVVNGRNNVPVRGATVVFTNTNYYKRQEKTTLVTDNGGKVLLPYDHCMAVITSGKDRLLWEGSKGYSPAEQATHLNGSIFTDLAIYHPGDTVKLAVVATSTDGKTVAVAPEKDLTVKFFDANYQEISSEKVKTDKYGRTETAFTIPTDGLTGRFTLRVLADERIIGSTSVEVADYKVPSFRVNLDNPEVASSGEELSNGEKKIVLTGVVMTYSGVPVAGAEVTLDVNFDPWWSRWMIEAPAEDEFGATATTDATGRFKAEVTLPATDDTSSYNFGRFYATATATSPAGETQTSLRKGFAVGEGFTLNYEGKNEVEVTKDKIDVRVQVTDLLGEPAMKELDFSLTQCDYSGEKEVSVVDKGSFKSPVLTLDAAKIASGVYKLRVVLPQAMKVSKGNQTEWEADTLEQELIFWRSGDKRPPLATAVWTPERVYYAKPGESQVDVTVGSGYEDEWLYMQIADEKGTRSREWLRPAGKNMTIKVKAPEAGECVSLYFVGCHNLKQESPVIRVLPAEANKTTLFKVDTFRDRIVPGDKETWKFRLMSGWKGSEKSDDSGMSALGDAAVMAVMSNEALDALTPFRWHFNPRGEINYMAIGGIETPWSRTLRYSASLSQLRYVKNPVQFAALSFLYGSANRLYSDKYMRSLSIRGTSAAHEDGMVEMVAMDYASPKANTVASAKMEASSDMALEEEMVVATGGIQTQGAGNGGGASTEVELREMEMPLAFFKPMLATDADGYVDVEFEVPNFNTTWAFQILGYDKEGYASVERLTTRASKPVMVSTLMPRFLLTGDKAQISATLMNATDEPLPVSGSIEIFDVNTGEVLAAEKMPALNLNANESKVITVTFTVPSDLGQLGVRAVAESERGSDGEQGVVAVLPSSAPVSDATTFYLKPGEKEFSVRLPKMQKGGNVTLNYCDNPFWYVLTSLSGNLAPDSESALEQTVALYSVATSAGMLAKYPRLREGVKSIFADDNEKNSITLSALNKNQSLKIASLNSTPWVNNAQSETMRMQGLDFLLDESGVKKVVENAIVGLEKTRNSNGSWSWMKGMPESLWITRQVLTGLGELYTSGYMPTDTDLRKKIETMIHDGIKYTDAEESKMYREVVTRSKGRYSLESELDYLYMRSNAGAPAAQGLIADMERDMYNRLPKEWRSLDLDNKMIASILLQRHGNHELARTILESVRQYASYKADKGMWFDGASQSWFAPSPILLTSRCLTAYLTVDPENAAVEELVQYLVLSRQTTDWNLELGQAGVASVVNSVVRAVKDEYIADGGDADINPGVEIWLGNKRIDLPARREMLTGNFCLDIDAEEASGAELRILRRNSSPAWGGVVNQYVAPIREVRAHSVPQLKITKALLPMATSVDGKSVSGDSKVFRKGERVRVTLTVETDRELDYLLISDQLGAWMQPASQLTEYSVQDGLWILTETRTSKKNFYITRMPKGKYILHYEVNVDRDGEYSTGIADAQCQYYPMITSHSAGAVVDVK